MNTHKKSLYQENFLLDLPADLLPWIMRYMGEGFAALSLVSTYFHKATMLSIATKRQRILSQVIAEAYLGQKTFHLNANGDVFMSLNNVDPSPRHHILEGIKQISAGQDHILALDNSGNIWGYGSNREGQLGLGTDILVQEEFFLILGNIKQMVTRDTFSLCLDKEGNVWGFGSNQYAQLGLGDIAAAHLPSCILENQKIIQITAGSNFAFCLAEDGRIWGFGSNSGGYLGLGDTPCQIFPAPIPEIENIKAISSGYRHTICLDNNNRLWGFGCNYDGQIHFVMDSMASTAVQDILTPGSSDICIGKEIIAINAIQNCSQIICSDNTYTYGQEPYIPDLQEEKLHSLVLLWDIKMLELLAKDSHPYIAKICSQALDKKRAMTIPMADPDTALDLSSGTTPVTAPDPSPGTIIQTVCNTMVPNPAVTLLGRVVTKSNLC